MGKSNEKVIQKFIKNYSIGDYIRFENPKFLFQKVRAKILNFDTSEDWDKPVVHVTFFDGSHVGETCYVQMDDVVSHTVNETRETIKKIGMWKDGL